MTALGVEQPRSAARVRPVALDPAFRRVRGALLAAFAGACRGRDAVQALRPEISSNLGCLGVWSGGGR